MDEMKLERISIEEAANCYFNGKMSAFSSAFDLVPSLVRKWKSENRHCIRLKSGRWYMESKLTVFLDLKTNLDESVQQCLFTELVDLMQKGRGDLAEFALLFDKPLTLVQRWFNTERMCYRASDTVWILDSKRAHILTFE